MKRKHTIAMAAAMLTFATATVAQTTALPKQHQEHILVRADGVEDKSETLSGINLTPTKKGTFQLDFSQQLEENAVLKITNTAGKLVYQKPVSVEGNRSSWRYHLGRLRPDDYMVEVKTSDTTYWTKFRVSK